MTDTPDTRIYLDDEIHDRVAQIRDRIGRLDRLMTCQGLPANKIDAARERTQQALSDLQAVILMLAPDAHGLDAPPREPVPGDLHSRRVGMHNGRPWGMQWGVVFTGLMTASCWVGAIARDPVAAMAQLEKWCTSAAEGWNDPPVYADSRGSLMFTCDYTEEPTEGLLDAIVKDALAGVDRFVTDPEAVKRAWQMGGEAMPEVWWSASDWLQEPPCEKIVYETGAQKVAVIPAPKEQHSAILSQEEQDRIARLIAAAPELAEALRQMLVIPAISSDIPEIVEEIQRVRSVALAALEKAGVEHGCLRLHGEGKATRGR